MKNEDLTPNITMEILGDSFCISNILVPCKSEYAHARFQSHLFIYKYGWSDFLYDDPSLSCNTYSVSS